MAEGEGPGEARAAAPLAGIAPTLAFGVGAHALIALVNIAATPILLRLMGPEAYGLVAFFLVLQGWMVLFDFGVSPTLARQLARFRAGALNAGDAAGLLAAAEAVFLGGGLVAGAVLALASPWIATHWLGRSVLSAGVLLPSLRLIALLLVGRWLAGLYQAALIGLERQNTVNALTAVSVTSRYGLAIAVLTLWKVPATAFFAVQAAITVAEAAASRLLLAGAMPASVRRARPAWPLLRAEFGFALGLTLASAAAAITSQADRLALSHALPLGEFGLFGLIVQVAAGITLLAPPFVQAFQPRLTALAAQGRTAEFAHVYRLATGLALALAAGLAGTIAARPEWVVWSWTGRADVARHLAPALTLYAAGGAISVFLFAPFLLQYAQGRVRLHVTGTVGFAVLWVPAAVWAAFAYGPVGTGWVWLAGNLAYLFFWTPLIHARLLPARERRRLDASLWLRGAVLALALTAVRFAPIPPLGRVETFLALAAIAIVTALAGAAMSSEARDFARHLAGGRRS